VPEEEQLREWLKLNRIQVSGTGLAPLISHPSVLPMILNEMNAVAKTAKLQGFEMVKAIHLHNDLFSVQNNILTPTFKLKRDYARKVFEKEIAKLYTEIEAQEKEKKKSGIKSAL
jgi:long-chain acyl-CoA synthetase